MERYTKNKNQKTTDVWLIKEGEVGRNTTTMSSVLELEGRAMILSQSTAHDDILWRSRE